MNATLTYTLTYKDVVTLLRAVREADAMDAFQLEFGGMKLSVTRTPAVTARSPMVPETTGVAPEVLTKGTPPDRALGTPAASTSTTATASATQGAEVAVKAPMLGTFYRAPSPSEPPFVKEGDVVSADHTVGLIEAMKLFTAIPAGVAGKVVRMVAPDATLVEFGQALVIIDPSQA
jgi:acetyl-CoA carboxylase biotin carboxyl carrier protein